MIYTKTYLLIIILLFSCTNVSSKRISTNKENLITLIRNNHEKSAVVIDTQKNNSRINLPTPKSLKFEGYEFEFGYKDYDEDKYGFSNPGFLKVKSLNKIIFSDKFEGEGEVFVKSLGFHELGGRKLIFTLNFGTSACDYNQFSRYYVIHDKEINFIGEYYSSCGGDGYACRVYNHIFPEESVGLKNSLLIIEGIKFNEHDQEDQFDTTQIDFTMNTFKLKKITNNLEKVK